MKKSSLLIVFAFALSCASPTKKPDPPPAQQPEDVTPKTEQPDNSGSNLDKGLNIRFLIGKRPGWTILPPSKNKDGRSKPVATLVNPKHGAQIPIFLQRTDSTLDEIAGHMTDDIRKQGAVLTPNRLDGSGRQDGIILAFEIVIDDTSIAGRIAIFNAWPDPRVVAVMVGFWPIGDDEAMSKDFAAFSESFTLKLE